MSENYPWPTGLRQRNGVCEVLEAALEAADPAQAVMRQLSLRGELLSIAGATYDLSRMNQVHLIGIGKAVVNMAQGVVSILGNRVTGGVLIAKHTNDNDRNKLPEQLRVLRGGHPVPDEHTFESTQHLLSYLEHVSEDDLVICLISGGGSALFSAPVPEITSEDLREVTRQLLACGAEINEINVLRKHLDQVKGGGLAELTAPARLVTLILSDVIGSPLDVIASGPTVPDSSTYLEMKRIIDQYQLGDSFPRNVMNLLQQGLAGEIADTPKPGDACFAGVRNVLVASNQSAAEAAFLQAEQAGFHSTILSTYLRGEAREAGRVLASIIEQISKQNLPLTRPACVILGGETTVTIQGSGMGGRNQELALGAIRDLSGLEDVLLVALATDGEDGPTDAAGAFVDGTSYSIANIRGLNADRALANNDAYHFFAGLDQLLMIGPTGTNVNDLAFLFIF